MVVLGVDITEPSDGWPIIAFHSVDVVPSKEVVENVLQSTNINICKHFRFSDASVSRLYSSDCEKLKWQRGLAPYCRCLTGV